MYVCILTLLGFQTAQPWVRFGPRSGGRVTALTASPFGSSGWPHSSGKVFSRAIHWSRARGAQSFLQKTRAAQKTDRRAGVQQKAIFVKKMRGLMPAMSDHFELVLDMMLHMRRLAAAVR